LYKYPHAEFPYAMLIEEGRRREKNDPEFELMDTGVFDGDRYFDVFAEYAKGGVTDMLMRLTVVNRGPEPAPLHILPQVWFRNTWSWGMEWLEKPELHAESPTSILATCKHLPGQWVYFDGALVAEGGQ